MQACLYVHMCVYAKRFMAVYGFLYTCIIFVYDCAYMFLYICVCVDVCTYVLEHLHVNARPQ